MRIAVLVSGSGSNLQALLDANLSGEVVGIISNRSDAYALQRAANANIATCVIKHSAYPERATFDAALHQQLLEWQVDLVILAGFMRILSASFVQQWEGKMLNIHPSLLPKYKGMHTHQRALDAGDLTHGCTVHFVTAELDAGQALAQGVLNIQPNDTAQTLADRVHTIEHHIYPMVVEWLCSGQMTYQDGFITYHQAPFSEPEILYFNS